MSNIGSKIDFIQLLKSLSNEKDIEIIDYNKDLVNLVNENLSEVQPKFLKDLEKIAENLNDDNLKKTYNLTEEHFHKLEKEKEEAEKKAEEERKSKEEEERKRKEAEEKAKRAEEGKIEAERKEAEERERRIQAELDKQIEEAKRIQAELDKLLAEKETKEQKEKNKNLSDKLNLESQKNQYLVATRETLSEDGEQLVHSIDLYVSNALKFVNNIFHSENNLPQQVVTDLYNVRNNIEKAIKISELVIKSSLLILTEFQTPNGVPPFDKIKLEHYEPAFQKGIEEQNANIQAIIDNTEAPTFENVIVALDNSSPTLDRVGGVFFNLTEAETTDELTALSMKLAPTLAEHEDNISRRNHNNLNPFFVQHRNLINQGRHTRNIQRTILTSQYITANFYCNFLIFRFHLIHYKPNASMWCLQPSGYFCLYYPYYRLLYANNARNPNHCLRSDSE
jgi:flagellar biosynthesis GTPase FlhF